MEIRRLVPIGILLLAVPAAAETNTSGTSPWHDNNRPRGGYIPIDPGAADIAEPTLHSSNIIYLNGCFGAGDCTFTPGNENSISNSSLIVKRTSTVARFKGSDQVWNAVVTCVKKTYAPFGVVITDDDPGSVPHFEAVVAGKPGDIDQPDVVGGVAPMDQLTCSVINNAITFSFANLYIDGHEDSGGSAMNAVPEICWTVAQETAHAFGLDHEFLCGDPMTYLTSCGADKEFLDVDAQCGETTPRSCACGKPSQNSVKELLAEFGGGDPTPPDVDITEPFHGTRVEPGYIVRATASDDSGVDRVELHLNGQLIRTSSIPPYVFNTPTDLSDGVHIVEVHAIDGLGHVGKKEIRVVQGEACTKSSGCSTIEACVDGRCVAGPDSPGGLGQVCQGHGDCVSGLCGEATDEKFCAERCDLGGAGCPKGFSCVDSGEFGVCWPGGDSGGCGCQVGTREGAPALLLLIGLAFGAMCWSGRRRRRRR